jgi:hypothetical protein
MADKFLTLLDQTKLTGNDSAIGIIEEVNTVAPELATMMGRPIVGLSYKFGVRTALPHAGGTPFRRVNEGTDIGASTYDQKLGECFFLDGQLQVDEALIDQGVAEGREPADILASEAAATLQEKFIQVGDQFYRGTTANANGFAGLIAQYDSTNCEVDATGTPGSATSAWLVYNDVQGVHFVYGANNGLMVGDWMKQQVTAPTGGKKQMAFVNNAKGWLGLAFGHTKSAIRIKNLTTATGKGLTDALVAEALSKAPIAMRQQKGKWKLFINTVASLQLQKSRSTVSSAKTDSGILQFAPEPTESQGVQVVLTDSIPNNE